MTDTLQTLDISTEGDAGGVAVTVRGEIDISTVPALRAALEEALAGAPAVLTLDLTGVSFLDSLGVAAILNARRRLPHPEQMLILVSTTSYARVVFDATGLSGSLNLATISER